MAQVDYLSHKNQSTPYNDLGSIRITRFNSKLPTNRSKVDNLQCIYFRREHSKSTSNNPNQANDNQALTGHSCESESDSVSNVLRWLKSLPPNFMINDLEENTDFNNSTEDTANWNQWTRRMKNERSKSLEFSLKSTGEVPLEGKRRMLTGKSQKINFKMDNTQAKCPRKRKCCKDALNPRLSKKSATSDLRALVKSEEDLFNDDRCQQRVGILKTGPNGRRRMMERKISSNRRLLHSIKEIISTVEEDERMNRQKGCKRRDDKTVLISSKIKVVGNSPRKPIFKNPEIEKTLDEAMRSTLKRYVHSCTWDNFKNNNNTSYGEPPVKKEKRALPSLTPVDSSHIDLSPIWNMNPVFNNICTF